MADEELLARLERALRPPPAEPGHHELAALRGAVEARAALPTRQRPWSRAWPRRAIAGAVAAAVLVFVVTSPPLPRPVRAAAHAIGLPVDSVEVADAKSAISSLRSALEDGDPQTVDRASDRLQRSLDALGDDDRRRLRRQSAPLLERSGRPPPHGLRGQTPGAPGQIPSLGPSAPPTSVAPGPPPSTTPTTSPTPTTTGGSHTTQTTTRPS